MKQRKLFIMALLMLAIGFASVATVMLLNGTTRVNTNSGDFNVYFSAASTDAGGTATIGTQTNTSDKITFQSKQLKTIGDTATLNYTVTNDSAIYDAEVSVTPSFTNTVSGKDYSSYYTVSYTGFDDDNTNKTTVNGKSSQNGTITITLTKPVLDEGVDIGFTVTLSAAAKERTSRATTVSGS